jgi:hypothetical protein
MSALKIRISPYPTRWRLPGDKTPSRQQLPAIAGIARKCIAHALTYHEIPPNIDAKIDALPSEEKLEELNPLQRDYLSFTVYNLKHMVAAGTISAETAWTLFFGEWGKVGEVEEGSFAGMRQTFMKNIREDVGDLAKEMDLLHFEFYARAGEAGLAQFERFNQWAENLIFDKETCKDMKNAVKDEYRKALWLEMRIIEGSIGLGDLNDDVQEFELSKYSGVYKHKKRGIGAVIDVFNGWGIDIIIKAEMGHWMFGLFPIHRWVDELMDAMNMTGYTKRINDALRLVHLENISLGILPPEGRAFLEGGYNYMDNYPVFPDRTLEPRSTNEIIIRYERAVFVERAIKERLIIASEKGGIEFDDVYKIYRRMGLYVTILSLEMANVDAEKTKEGILKKIHSFDLNEIDEYCNSYLESILRDENARMWSRGIAARALIRLKNLEEDSNEHKQLYACRLTGEGKWEEVVKLDEAALPALEVALNDNDFSIKGKAAQALIKLKEIEKGSDEYNRLYVYQLIGEERWDEIFELGRAANPALLEVLKSSSTKASAREFVLQILRITGDETVIPALKEALADENSINRMWSVIALGMLGETSIIPDLEALFNDHFIIRSLAAEALIRAKGLEEESDEYKELYAYKLVKGKKWDEIVKLGKPAIPALECSINNWHYEEEAFDTLKRIRNSDSDD